MSKNQVIIINEQGQKKIFNFDNPIKAIKFADKHNPGDKMKDGTIIKSIQTGLTTWYKH